MPCKYGLLLYLNNCEHDWAVLKTTYYDPALNQENHKLHLSEKNLIFAALSTGLFHKYNDDLPGL